MKVGIVVFPGSNCDRDLHISVSKMGAKAVYLWHKDSDLQGCDMIFLPGGFSYGDYLRSGAIAQFSPIMKEIIKFANDGGYVMGICNGFQILTETGLLPGALLHNPSDNFICKNTYIKPANRTTFVTQTAKSKAYKIPIAHKEGRYYCNDDTLKKLYDNEQILFKYCDETGKINDASNPNGSIENIAGICNENKNVFGMMPHPERAYDEDLENKDGSVVFESIMFNEFAV